MQFCSGLILSRVQWLANWACSGLGTREVSCVVCSFAPGQEEREEASFVYVAQLYTKYHDDSDLIFYGVVRSM